MISKLDQYTPCLTKTGAGSISLKAGTTVVMPGFKTLNFPVDSVVTMPTLVAGTDYAVYVTPDGNVVASSNFTAPTGYNAATIRKIGGFHYAAGGNASATARAGGDTTPAINLYSIWDLKFRPSAADPRGMVRVPGVGWVDIYLANVDCDLNGTSKSGVVIADGASLPKIPSAIGGDGSAAFGSFNWYNATRLAAAYGKRLLDYGEFLTAAFGVTEATAIGVEPPNATIDAPRTSIYGLMQASGNMWVWGKGELLNPGGTGGAGWKDITDGGGQAYLYNDEGLKKPLFGADWADGSAAGSRAAYWANSPLGSYGSVGLRCACDHVCLP